MAISEEVFAENLSVGHRMNMDQCGNKLGLDYYNYSNSYTVYITKEKGLG